MEQTDYQLYLPFSSRKELPYLFYPFTAPFVIPAIINCNVSTVMMEFNINGNAVLRST